MKKIVCILTAFICCIGVAASAESHIGIQGSIADRTDSNIVYIDLYEEDNTISMISDLIPDIIIQSANDHADLYDMFRIFFDLSTEKTISLRNEAENLYRDWIQSRYSETNEGIYTGPLFEKATSVCVTEFMLSDLIHYVVQQSGKNPVSQNSKNSEYQYDEILLAAAAEMGSDAVKYYNPLVRTKNYDHYKYISFDIISGNQVILSLSMDNSHHNRKRILITHMENGRYYFRDIAVQYNQQSIIMDCELFSSDKSVFDPLRIEPLIHESFSLTSENGKHSQSIAYTCENSQKELLVSGTGTLSYNKIEGYLQLGEEKEDVVFLTATMDEKQKPDLSSYQMMHMDHKEENDLILNIFMSGLMERMTHILPLFPAFYQNIIMKILMTR